MTPDFNQSFYTDFRHTCTLVRRSANSNCRMDGDGQRRKVYSVGNYILYVTVNNEHFRFTIFTGR